jgi:hypothetical protein
MIAWVKPQIVRASRIIVYVVSCISSVMFVIYSIFALIGDDRKDIVFISWVALMGCVSFLIGIQNSIQPIYIAYKIYQVVRKKNEESAMLEFTYFCRLIALKMIILSCLLMIICWAVLKSDFDMVDLAYMGVGINSLCFLWELHSLSRLFEITKKTKSCNSTKRAQL